MPNDILIILPMVLLLAANLIARKYYMRKIQHPVMTVLRLTTFAIGMIYFAIAFHFLVPR